MTREGKTPNLRHDAPRSIYKCPTRLLPPLPEGRGSDSLRYADGINCPPSYSGTSHFRERVCSPPSLSIQISICIRCHLHLFHTSLCLSGHFRSFSTSYQFLPCSFFSYSTCRHLQSDSRTQVVSAIYLLQEVLCSIFYGTLFFTVNS
jgi:hypothetical protein